MPVTHRSPDWMDALPASREAVPTEVLAPDIHRLEAKLNRVIALLLELKSQAGACPPR